MSADRIVHDILEGVQAIASALTPAAVGAAIGQAWEKGLSWTQRISQWVVGICVSYYVGFAIEAAMNLDAFVADAVKFIIAMIAFQATPRFIRGAVDAVGTLPDRIRDRFFPPASTGGDGA